MIPRVLAFHYNRSSYFSSSNSCCDAWRPKLKLVSSFHEAGVQHSVTHIPPRGPFARTLNYIPHTSSVCSFRLPQVPGMTGGSTLAFWSLGEIWEKKVEDQSFSKPLISCEGVQENLSISIQMMTKWWRA